MILNDENFLLYAAKMFDTTNCMGSEEFYDDMKRFQYLRRLFRRYEDENDLRVRLILNHLIILYNMFGPAATNMLFFKLKEYHSALKPFVVMLNYMPDYIEYETYRIPSSTIKMDDNIIKELREL